MSPTATILDFWFGAPDDPEFGRPRKAWFTNDPAFDDEMRRRFLADYEKAARGELDALRSSAEGCLALCILLDQFPRNAFRGDPRAFATDAQAVAVAEHAIAQGFDRQLLPVQRWFLYLPYEHSEDLAHQRRAVELFGAVSEAMHDPEPVEWAVKHLRVIERFGRFPHRNAVLGRTSTPEEIEFLKGPDSSF
jgi:uncharacterized protein (DUF924 family)